MKINPWPLKNDDFLKLIDKQVKIEVGTINLQDEKKNKVEETLNGKIRKVVNSNFSSPHDIPTQIEFELDNGESNNISLGNLISIEEIVDTEATDETDN